MVLLFLLQFEAILMLPTDPKHAVMSAFLAFAQYRSEILRDDFFVYLFSRPGCLIALNTAKSIFTFFYKDNFFPGFVYNYVLQVVRRPWYSNGKLKETTSE